MARSIIKTIQAKTHTLRNVASVLLGSSALILGAAPFLPKSVNIILAFVLLLTMGGSALAIMLKRRERWTAWQDYIRTPHYPGEQRFFLIVVAMVSFAIALSISTEQELVWRLVFAAAIAPLYMHGARKWLERQAALPDLVAQKQKEREQEFRPDALAPTAIQEDTE